MTFNIIDKPYVITIFIEAAVDPVGCGDRTEDLTSKNSDDNIRSENSIHIITGEETLG